jgi:hypothetical protein
VTRDQGIHDPTHRRPLVHWFGGVILLLISISCRPAFADDDGPNRHGQGVIVRPGTRIVSARQRNAQDIYDPATGYMHFVSPGREDDSFENIRKGNVLVSAPSTAAPYGYLRRITGVGSDASGVWMTSVPARLNDAIKDAHVSISILLPTDGSTKPIVVQGPLVLPALPASTGPSPFLGISNGSNYPFDVEYHDQGIDIVAKGHELSYYGVSVGVDIDGWCAVDGDPCFTFDAEAKEHADAYIDVTGQFHTSFSKSWPVVDKAFDPIVFAIGPVPVVLVPNLKIDFNFNGSASGAFEIAGSASAPEYRMSIHWDSGNGFSNGFSETPASMSPGPINLTGDADLHANLPARLDMRLYDAAGIDAILTGDVDAKFHIPGKPRWSLDGELKGEIGVDASLPIIGDLGSSQTTLFDEKFHLAESVNSPPHVKILTPVDGQNVSFNWPDFGQVTLHAEAGDDEDGTPCCTIAWFLADGTPLANGNDQVITLPGVGHFDLYARATDSDGASTNSATVGIDTSVAPPGAGIVVPGASCAAQVYTNLPTRLLGRDGQNLGNGPYSCYWSSDNAADQSQFPAAEASGTFNLLRGCELDVTFPTTDVRTITLGVVPDLAGAPTSAASKTVRVLDPPPGGIPLLREPGPAACEQVTLDANGGQLQSYVEVRGSVGGPTQISWTWQPNGCAAVPMPVHRHVPTNCTPDYCAAPFTIVGSELESATPASCAGVFAQGTATVTATDSAGHSNSTQFFIGLQNQIVR